MGKSSVYRENLVTGIMQRGITCGDLNVYHFVNHVANSSTSICMPDRIRA